MKVSEITSILAQANLPPLTRDQLLELAGTKGGRQFAAALRDFAAGDRSRRDELEATVLVMDPKVRTTLGALGADLAVDRLAATARKEQRRFFDAVAAIAQRTRHAASARQYLTGLGVIPPLHVAPAPQTAPPYYSFKIFGASAALCIAEAQTRATNQHTVNIEGAGALGGSSGPKNFDWQNKIVVQLTVQEAYQVLALFENKLRSLRFDGHGRAHDKSLHIEHQESHHFIKLIQRGRPAIAVPVRPVDAIPLISLLYKQLLRNEPHLRIEDIRSMVDRMAAMAGAQA